jgi:DNA-binding transcriptional regulator GbsR (MarR family)
MSENPELFKQVTKEVKENGKEYMEQLVKENEKMKLLLEDVYHLANRDIIQSDADEIVRLISKELKY